MISHKSTLCTRIAIIISGMEKHYKYNYNYVLDILLTLRLILRGARVQHANTRNNGTQY